MLRNIDQALTLVQDLKSYLQEEKNPIFADSFELDYFRSYILKKKKEAFLNRNTPSEVKPSPPPEPEKKIATPPLSPPTVQIPIQEKKDLKIAPSNPIDLPKLPKISSSTIQLHTVSFHWKSVLGKMAPKIAILDEIPHDHLAKKIKNQWKTKNQTAPISILYYQEIPEHKELLDQITIALDVYFGPAKQVSAQAIEKEKQWEAFLSVPELKIVICCDYTLWQLSSLMQFYKETPHLKKRQLGEKSLFLLPDLSLYLKDPLLKRSLWKAFNQILSASSATKV